MSLEFRYKLVNKGQDMEDIFWLMFSQEALDNGSYPFHCNSQLEETVIGMKNFVHGAKRSKKYQVIFVGTHEQCHLQLEECLKFLRLKHANFQY